ncbi:MAG TPA: hypothetical protein VHH57_06690 [Gaiella sp.]|nr:hypothetical protein [Gaiella sp.]
MPRAPAELTQLLELGEVAVRRRREPRDDFLTLPNVTGMRW